MTRIMLTDISPDGVRIVVPNSHLLENMVVNWNLGDDDIRTFISVGVAYGSPVRLVAELIEKAVTEQKDVLPDPSPRILFQNFGDSALDFELRCFIYDIGYVLDVKSRLHFAIDKAFREHNIEIAFPQRDIHIRSNAESYSANE